TNNQCPIGLWPPAVSLGIGVWLLVIRCFVPHCNRHPSTVEWRCMVELPNIPAAALAKRVVRKLRQAGHEALLAGGCVRDLLLRRDPKDYDVATSASRDDVEALFEHTVVVGKAFGVIKVLDDTIKSLDVEVAT